MLEINLLGCCVSRDVFSYDNEKRYSIKHFMQGSSPISMLYSSKPYQSFRLEDINIGSPWEKRCFLAELNSSFLDAIKEWDRGDWFIFDSCELRYPLYMSEHPDGKYYLSSSFILDKNLDLLESEKFSGDKFESYKLSDFSDTEIQNIAKDMADFLKTIADEDRIIINEIYLVKEYLAKIGTISSMDDNFYIRTGVNTQLKYFTEEIIKFLPKAHIIRFPENVLCDESNKWGLSPLHFFDDYYKYVYNAINIITSQCGNEKKALNTLWQATNMCFAEKMQFYNKRSERINNRINFANTLFEETDGQNGSHNLVSAPCFETDWTFFKDGVAEGFFDTNKKILYCSSSNHNYTGIRIKLNCSQDDAGKSLVFCVKIDEIISMRSDIGYIQLWYSGLNAPIKALDIANITNDNLLYIVTAKIPTDMGMDNAIYGVIQTKNGVLKLSKAVAFIEE